MGGKGRGPLGGEGRGLPCEVALVSYVRGASREREEDVRLSR